MNVILSYGYHTVTYLSKEFLVRFLFFCSNLKCYQFPFYPVDIQVKNEVKNSGGGINQKKDYSLASSSNENILSGHRLCE